MNQPDAAPDAGIDAAYEAKLRADFEGESRDDVLRDYREMLRIRRFEEAAARAYTRGKISGFLHLYIGQEAIAVATRQVMEPGDRVVSTYRTHGFALALGSDPKACAAELYGKATGLVAGVGGSMHFFDRERGLWGGYAIVGNHIPVAAGHAFASKYLGDGRVTLCFMGDGAVGIGPVHEGMTMAGIMKLPIVFAVENNQYSMGTPLHRTLPVEDITARAAGYGFASDRFHVTSVQETRRRLAEAVARARSENRPTLVELITYRFRGHSMSDPAKYRQKDEVERWRRNDPLERTFLALKNIFGVSEEELDAIDEAVVQEMDAAYDFADRSPLPDPQARFANVMAEGPWYGDSATIRPADAPAIRPTEGGK
ncbi:MAG TPA: thiamine pyrophosphate-dependent enzyme [Nannocystis sp.]